LTPKKIIDTKSGAFFDSGHDRANDWSGGDLFLGFHAGDRYRVTTNTENDMEVAIGGGQPDLLNNQPLGSIADHSYTTRDDEVSRALRLTAAGNTLLRDLLVQAFVRVREHAGDDINPNPVIPWRGTVRVLDLIVKNATFLPRDARNSASFWVVPVVLAFEGLGAPRDKALSLRDEERVDTHDPGIPPPDANSDLLGYTAVPAGVGNQPTAVSFAETIRDFAETNASEIRATVPLAGLQSGNAAHEVLHALSLGHTGGIMCATRKNYIADTTGQALTVKQLAALRAIGEPAIGAGEGATCGKAGSPPSPDCCPARPPKI